MSPEQTAPPTDGETQPEIVQAVSELMTPEFVEHRKQWLQDQMKGQYDSALGHVGRLIDRVDKLNEDSITAVTEGEGNLDERWQRRDKLEAQAERTFDIAVRTFGSDKVVEYRGY